MSNQPKSIWLEKFKYHRQWRISVEKMDLFIDVVKKTRKRHQHIKVYFFVFS